MTFNPTSFEPTERIDQNMDIQNLKVEKQKTEHV